MIMPSVTSKNDPNKNSYDGPTRTRILELKVCTRRRNVERIKIALFSVLYFYCYISFLRGSFTILSSSAAQSTSAAAVHQKKVLTRETRETSIARYNKLILCRKHKSDAKEKTSLVKKPCSVKRLIVCLYVQTAF